MLVAHLHISRCTDSTLPVGWEMASAELIIAPGGEAQIDASASLSASGTSKQLAEALTATRHLWCWLRWDY